jgi:hypothetical protein
MAKVSPCKLQIPLQRTVCSVAKSRIVHIAAPVVASDHRASWVDLDRSLRLTVTTNTLVLIRVDGDVYHRTIAL